VLDGIVLSGHALDAELEGDAKTVSRAFENEGLVFHGDDFAIHSGGDEVYYLSKPLSIAGAPKFCVSVSTNVSVLEAGENARRRIWYVLAAYLLVSTSGAVLLVRRLTRPLNELREASRKVSGGAFDRPLSTTSSLHEVRELTQDLEFMRDRLTTANAQLLREIAERESSEQTRHKLEQQLRQQQKLRELARCRRHRPRVQQRPGSHPALHRIGHRRTARRQPHSRGPAGGRSGSAARRAVVRQILLFARHMDDGERERIDLRSAVGDTVGLVRALMPAQLEVIEDYGGTPLPIVGNWALLGQVVMNLCTNARQAMRERGGTLLVRTGSARMPPAT
jgi:signal transduction histidine kinase